MALDEVAARGLVLLGCGKMGTALLKGWLDGGLPASAVHVIEPRPSEWLQGSGVAVNGALPGPRSRVSRNAGPCLMPRPWRWSP